MSPSQSDKVLVERLRSGDEEAWRKFVERFEGRLTAYVRQRIRDRTKVEEVVQDVFIGFSDSLWNYDPDQSLENYLFSIARHKTISALRRASSRLSAFGAADSASGSSSFSFSNIPGHERRPSTIVRSQEGREFEEKIVAQALQRLVAKWIKQKRFERLKCFELLIVRGASNKHAAEVLGISENKVAVHKHRALAELEKEIATLLSK